MENLEHLLYWRGIASTYFNYRGEEVGVSLENRLRLLRAMGVNTESDEEIARQAFALDVAPWLSWLPPMLMANVGEGTGFQMNAGPDDLDEEMGYSLTLESGAVKSGTFYPQQCEEVGDYNYEGVRYSRRHVPLDRLPIGYHTLVLTGVKDGQAKSQTAHFVVVPEQAYTPNWVVDNKRPWGIIVQLYTLRSARNWGIGDFTDLKLLIDEAASAGVDMVGLNPLHALRTPVEHHCSPYSPSDRRFLNPLYIDPEVEPEFRQDPKALLPYLVRLRAADKVPYNAVARIKATVFREMYAVFVHSELAQSTPRAKKFLQFIAESGAALQDFCLYQVLQEVTGQHIEQLPAHEKQEAFERYAERVQYEAYLQWLADEQLESCQRHAKERGMRIGLMRDLAVGADGGGAEVSTNMALFCRDAAVGAPPDPLAEKGQNWGLPPMDPATLRLTNFEHFITLLRTNMNHCGALRIDHAMSLMRLWWCPPGHTADYGAYVYYPFYELLGLLKLESVRNRCVVIGEDMGVVPPEFREALYSSNIFTNKLFYFEKNHDGSFKPPQDYEAHSLAMLTNHDVPTLASWWRGSDLQLRQSLNLLEDGADYEAVLVSRDREKVQLLEWLARLQLVQRETFADRLAAPLTNELASAILHGVSQCSSQIFVVQLEDLELLDEPVNVPGTSYQYPNWQRKLAVPLEMLFAEDRVQALLHAIAMERS